MSSEALRKQPDNARAPDPNVAQGKASNPASSVWVTASAGTGKTKVLTDRVLRLLLPRADKQPGTKPSKILCLTFTRAGAGEMSLRLNETLARWAVMDEHDLREKLEKLLARKPSLDEIAAARRLFAEVSDTPGGLKIMTIHSFCQSVLGRFPLEAGIAPHFRPLEEFEAAALLEQARDEIINTSDPAIDRIALVVNEERFFDLIRAIVKEREQLRKILENTGGIKGLYKKLCDTLGIPPNREPQQMLEDACHSASHDEPALRQACKALADHGTKTDSGSAVKIQNWLDDENRIAQFEDYQSAFLTDKGDVRKKLAGVDVERAAPGTLATLQTEAERLHKLQDQINAAASALLTRDLLSLGEKIIARYQQLKSDRAALDFDDLIFLTCALLEGRAQNLKGDNAAAWVLYKLDEGLDHILVDEAQDTNPEQWRVVETLVNEFTSGLAAHDVERTIFVVGDKKQSIYSFQRASRELFEDMHGILKKKIENADKTWDPVPMQISFRSTKSVLAAVDAVFQGPAMQGVSQTPVEHNSFRIGQAGRVELWPLFETTKGPATEAWTLPIEIIESRDGASALAAHIADQVASWIGREELPARGRKVKAGDIMILLRTRNALFRKIAKALKDRKINVSGTDRMILNDQIAVQDLMAFAAFALQPLDNLSLACLLKSPLVGMDENTLFELAHYREKEQSLWSRLIDSKHTDIKNYLDAVLRNAANLRPFDFFTWLLQHPCPGDKISGLRALQSRLGSDIIDPLDEFLSSVLDFEAQNPPALQHFVQRQQREETEIKREMEEGGNQVRIMTVHGSKGLQAPIVILPDTVRTRRGASAKADSRLLWPDKTGLEDLPLWTPRSEESFEFYDNARTALDQREDEEYRRLLYVAMTRAEDRLYLAGCTGKQTSSLESWYDSLSAGIQTLENIETLPDGALRLDNPQTRDPDKAAKTTAEKKETAKIPTCLYEPAAPERMPDAPLRPSRADEYEPAVNSPLQPGNPFRFRRGNLTHKLLEFLPDIADQNRGRTAENFLNRYAADIPADMRASIVKETLDVLNHPEFSAVFGPGSLAEIPLAGKLADGREVSGQIDRLLITGDKILIVDYKTNRPPPLDPKDVPPIYINQMRLYRDILLQIYPGRTISCALLWTDGTRLMPLAL